MQDLEQVDHAPNDDTTQCTAHPCSLQLRTARKYGQSAPPWTATAVTERVRCTVQFQIEDTTVLTPRRPCALPSTPRPILDSNHLFCHHSVQRVQQGLPPVHLEIS